MKKSIFESLKFFCAAILCLCLSAFTSPSWGANCNLFNGYYSAAVTLDETNNVLSNKITDTRTGFHLQVQILKTDNSYFSPISQTNIATGKKTFTFNVPEDIKGFFIKHNGLKQDIHFASNTLRPSAGIYTLSFDVLSNDPTTVGGLQLKNIQLERGDTATTYTPYNPLCETCDGTIVNYTSATGTVVQDGAPTPDNPIEPTFYKQGNMVLRKVGDVADSYDATTGKITRRVGVKVLDGTENWIAFTGLRGVYQVAGRFPTDVALIPNEYIGFCSHFSVVAISASISSRILNGQMGWNTSGYLTMKNESYTTVAEFKQFLADQYAAGTPVTIYYPLATEVEEDWPASYCETPIKIATTKYNETAFSPLNTALANAISVVDSVVSNTITQAGRIADLQAQKQTRPADDPSDANNAENCPAGKKCLLVTDTSGIPHWYEIVTGRLPDGYTELEYIESTGTQYIDTGIQQGTASSYATELVYKFTVNNDRTSLCGVRVANYNAWGQVYTIGGKSEIWGGNPNALISTGLTTALNTVYTDKFEVDVTNGTFVRTRNGETSTKSGITFTPAYPGNVYLFGYNPGTAGVGQPASVVMYSTKIWKDGVLVRDFVPAKNPDGKIGMYDLVNGVFYENKGTGEFIGGQPVFN